MLPIATIAITSLFLVLGGLIESLGGSKSSWTFIGTWIKAISYPILQALPLLFCVAFTITFTKNNGLAVWCSIIAYFSFIYMQSAFITPKASAGNTKQLNYEFLIFNWSKLSSNMNSLVHRVFGVATLNTSVIGSILIGGLIVPYLFKHYSNLQFNQYLAYFSGKRFLPLACVLAMAPLSLLFLVFWPLIGIGMHKLGGWIAQTPYGIDSFLFGVLEKSLIPTGLHHIFASSLWYTSLGGDVIQKFSEINNNGSNNNILNTLQQTYLQGMGSFTSWQGDSFIGLSALSLPKNSINGAKVFKYFEEILKIKIGRFTQGKFPVMQFGLPAAALAMYFAAPKQNRKIIATQLIAAAFTSFIIGITEPIEFTFLFTAPWLFYGFHVLMCGVSFMLMNILGAHIPTVFSGGFIELCLFGIIPVAKGTAFWWWLVVGSILAPLYFLVFYGSIKFWNIKTPGREDNFDANLYKAKEVKHENKDSLKENLEKDDQKSTTINNNEIPKQIELLIEGFGGWENIANASNCASRLRYDIVDKSKVNETILKQGGVIAVKWIGDKHVQSIVGPKAESINNEMLKWKETTLEKSN